MKTLFLLTKTYPFGNGEQYITNELPYLAKVFNKIIIYPNDYYSGNTAHNKILPINVEVLNFNSTHFSKTKNKLSDYVYLIKNTLIEFFETDDKKHFIKNFKWNLINFWTQFQIAKSFSKYLKTNNYNSTNSAFYSYWFHKSAILLAILKDKKHISSFVSRAHSIDLYHNHWRVINQQVKVPPFKLFKLKRIDKLYTVTQHGEQFLNKHYPFFNNKVSTSYLGVFNTTINNSQKTITSNGAFQIVTCSGIDFNKRVIALAEALVNIKQSVKWTHFGDGNLKEQLFNITSTFPQNVIFDFKGKTPNQEIKKFYSENSINLFVNLSIVEGLPVSIMEAMMYHIPVLATAVYGTPEAVIDNENGFLLDVNFTQQQLIDKLNYCIEHKNQLFEMGKKSHEFYLQKFDANKNYTGFANILKIK